MEATAGNWVETKLKTEEFPSVPFNICISLNCVDSMEKPPIVQLLKNFPTFYGTRWFIAVVTRAPPLVPILSQINPIHTTPSYLSKI
jgi:hypothetical protein